MAKPLRTMKSTIKRGHVPVGEVIDYDQVIELRGVPHRHWRGLPCFPEKLYPTVRVDCGEPSHIRVKKSLDGAVITCDRRYEPETFRLETIEKYWGKGTYILELYSDASTGQCIRLLYRTYEEEEGEENLPFPGDDWRQEVEDHGGTPDSEDEDRETPPAVVVDTPPERHGPRLLDGLANLGGLKELSAIATPLLMRWFDSRDTERRAEQERREEERRVREEERRREDERQQRLREEERAREERRREDERARDERRREEDRRADERRADRDRDMLTAMMNRQAPQAMSDPKLDMVVQELREIRQGSAGGDELDKVERAITFVNRLRGPGGMAPGEAVASDGSINWNAIFGKIVEAIGPKAAVAIVEKVMGPGAAVGGALPEGAAAGAAVAGVVEGAAAGAAVPQPGYVPPGGYS